MPPTQGEVVITVTPPAGSPDEPLRLTVPASYWAMVQQRARFMKVSPLDYLRELFEWDEDVYGRMEGLVQWAQHTREELIALHHDLETVWLEHEVATAVPAKTHQEFLTRLVDRTLPVSQCNDWRSKLRERTLQRVAAGRREYQERHQQTKGGTA